MKENFKRQSGITLIALIITIIVMLILVAVTVRVVVNSGLFKHAGNVAGGYDMQQARERLETTLASAQTEKYTNPGYNQNDYLDSLIQMEIPEAAITDNTVIVDGWAFELDRSVPKIDQDLGKQGNYTLPDLTLSHTVSDDFLSATITITAQEAEHGISKIEVISNGEVVESFDCGGSKEQITKTYTVEENKMYTVKVYSDKNRTGRITVTGIAGEPLINVDKKITGTDARTAQATIMITAKEEKFGISKIEIIKDDNVIKTYTYANIKDEIKENYQVTENGTYTVKAYSKLESSATIGIEAILTTGDYISYTPDTASAYSLAKEVSGYTSDQSIAQETLKWRVMSINEDGTIDLISAAPIATSVYFQGALGYNNGVYLLNDLCKTQYSNSRLAVTARSLNLEDIEKKFTNAGIKARNAYIFDETKYGETKTYSGSKSYAPDIYDHVGTTTAEESKNYYSSPTTATYEQKGTLSLKQTYYSLRNTPSNYFDDTTLHQLIFGTETLYWLASRSVNCGINNAGFILCNVYRNAMGGFGLFNSYISTNCGYGRVRPVVHLGSNIKISTAGGTEDSPREISL